MRTLTIIVSTIALTFLTSFSSKNKVYLIYIKQELAIAKAIQTIKIYNYTDSTMIYGVTNSKDTLIIKSKRGKFLNLTEAGKVNKEQALLKHELGGSWPAIGQSVLMVTDSTNSVRLFAFRVDNDYRFWDPNSIPFANSIFIFPKEKPFKPLPICLQYIEPSDYWSCSDGCLIDANAIKQQN